MASALGDYLRARRRQVRPEDVGLVAGKRRRVAGLRREELATLAGISSAYYLRLEQGSATHPSGQVVDALAGTAAKDNADDLKKIRRYLEQRVGMRKEPHWQALYEARHNLPG